MSRSMFLFVGRWAVLGGFRSIHAAVVNVYNDSACQGQAVNLAVDDADLCNVNLTSPDPYVRPTVGDNKARCMNPAQLELLEEGHCAVISLASSGSEFWRLLGSAPACLTEVIRAPQGGDVKVSHLTLSRRRRTHAQALINPPEGCSVKGMEIDGFAEDQKTFKMHRVNGTELIWADLEESPPKTIITVESLIAMACGFCVFLFFACCGPRCWISELIQPEDESPISTLLTEFSEEQTAWVLTPETIAKIRRRNFNTAVCAFVVLLVLGTALQGVYSEVGKNFNFECENCTEAIRCACDVPWRACDVPAAFSGKEEEKSLGGWNDTCLLPDPDCFGCKHMGYKKGFKEGRKVGDGRTDSCQGDVCFWGPKEDWTWNNAELLNAVSNYPTQYTIPDSCSFLPEFVPTECPAMDTARSKYVALQFLRFQFEADKMGPFIKLVAMIFYIPLAVLTFSLMKKVEVLGTVGDPVQAFLEKARNKKKKNLGKKCMSGIEKSCCQCCATLMCCGLWSKACPASLKFLLIVGYVAFTTFAEELSFFVVSSPPLIVGTVDRCSGPDPHIAVIVTKGASDFLANMPGCLPDYNLFDIPNFSFPSLVLDFLPNIALPAIDMSLFLPTLALPVLVTLYCDPAVKKALMLCCRRGAKVAQRRAVEEMHKPTVEKMEQTFRLSQPKAEEEWAEYIKPFLLAVDPWDFETLKEELQATIQMRLVAALKAAAIQKLQEPPWKYSPTDADLMWQIILRMYEEAADTSAMEYLPVIIAALNGELNGFLEKFVKAGEDVAKKKKKLISSKRSTVGAPVNLI